MCREDDFPIDRDLSEGVDYEAEPQIIIDVRWSMERDDNRSRNIVVPGTERSLARTR